MISDHKKTKYSAANSLGNKFMEFGNRKFCDVPLLALILWCAQLAIRDEKDIVAYTIFCAMCGCFMCALVRCINTFKIRL